MNNIKSFSVLLTCCTMQASDLILCLRNNEDNVDVKVYAANNRKEDLPSESLCEKTFVLPNIRDKGYIQSLLQICKQYNISIIIPKLSAELELLAKNKSLFEYNRIKVSVSSLDSLKIANDKIELSRKYSQYMPVQIVAKSIQDVIDFKNRCNTICCKISNAWGGKGFAVVDDIKCDDVSYFHAYGKKHFISFEQLCRVVDKNKNHAIILQEYHAGLDYTVSLLADHGKILYMCGYVGYLLEFGCILYGEIRHNNSAYNICTKIVSDLKLDGNVGVDFILNDDDSVVLLEINPRINATVSLVSKAGCNLPYLRCKQLLGYNVNNVNCEINDKLKIRKRFEAEYFI